MRGTEQVDQALFGYSDGHRQISASLRLPSKDLYNLSAASDLAGGAKLNADESYLTGLPLAESRHYALIRTWPAPEMPRPGCVWSHVLLIDFRLLSSKSDLSEFLGLLNRPVDPNAKIYGEPISLASTSPARATPHYESVTEIIGSYYSDNPVYLDGKVERNSLEASILAVWSQQWPRLRTSFSFRTAAGGERRKSELIKYDVQVGSRPAPVAREEADGRWIAAAAADAQTGRVTPLRRFLWRYGRDLATPRRHYRTLVELFLETENRSEVSSEQAVRIFDAIPKLGDGEILKRDILGIGTASPAPCPAVSLPGLLRLLASGRLGIIPTEHELTRRLASVPPDEIATLAMYIDRHGPALGQWEKPIQASVIASANHSTITSELSDRFRRIILMARPDLVDRTRATALSDEGLLELLSHHAADDVGRTLSYVVVRRDFGLSNAELLKSRPSDIFGAAVTAARSHELDPAWVSVIGDNASAILNTHWPIGVSTTTDLTKGLVLLRFPKRSERTADVWAGALSSMSDDVTGDDRTRLHGFLLKEALQTKCQGSWKLAAAVLPELRPIILNGTLPTDVYQMLMNDLPRFNSVGYWDINKRILASLSQLRRSIQDDEALNALNLSRDEMHFVLEGADKEEKRSMNPFWWF